MKLLLASASIKGALVSSSGCDLGLGGYLGPLILGNQIRYLVSSFVRSVTMDKWKDIELEKMKAGGNAKFREFLEAQEDYEPNWSLQDKYSSRAAALFRDKVRANLACFIHRGECIVHIFIVARIWL